MGYYSGKLFSIRREYFLDKYPDASLAYSLRLLNKDYSGNCILVRRSTDNAELNIGFVGGILDISSLLSFCGSGNGFIKTWYDQSGNSKNASNFTNANQPQIVLSGSVILTNAKPSVYFNGGSMYLSAGEHLLSTIIGTNLENTSLFVSSDEGSGSHTLISYYYSNSIKYVIHAAFNGIIYYDSGNESTRRKSVDIPSGWHTTQKIITALSDSNNSAIRVNSVSLITGGVSGSVSLSNLRNISIGALLAPNPLYLHKGTMQEIIIYKSYLNNNISSVESDINSFYNTY